MQVQINTGHDIDGREAVAAHITSVVESALHHTSDHVTRVEVHVTDANSDKKGGGSDMRCTMEARLEGQQPIAVTHDAATVHQAVDGAAAKLAKRIDSTLGRLRDVAARRG